MRNYQEVLSGGGGCKRWARRLSTIQPMSSWRRHFDVI